MRVHRLHAAVVDNNIVAVVARGDDCGGDYGRPSFAEAVYIDTGVIGRLARERVGTVAVAAGDAHGARHGPDKAACPQRRRPRGSCMIVVVPSSFVTSLVTVWAAFSAFQRAMMLLTSADAAASSACAASYSFTAFSMSSCRGQKLRGLVHLLFQLVLLAFQLALLFLIVGLDGFIIGLYFLCLSRAAMY